MNGNYKNNLLLQLLKLLGAFIVSWFLMVCIFAAATTGDEIPEKYSLPMVVIAIFLSFAVNIIIDFNAIARLKSAISKSKADIDSVNETSAALIDKAERVADKYRNAETDLYGKFAKAREGGAKIRTSKDFKAVIEAYPELQSNVHTQKLLNQIETTENAKLNAKMAYTEAVAKYNAKIHSFPVVILRRICKWKDVDIETGISADEMVSDEDLGI